MPRVAGMLKWSQELRDRVNSSLDKLKCLDKGYCYIYHNVIYTYVYHVSFDCGNISESLSQQMPCWYSVNMRR